MFFELPRNWLSQKGLRAVVFVKNICQSHRLPAGLRLLVSGISDEAGLEEGVRISGLAVTCTACMELLKHRIFPSAVKYFVVYFRPYGSFLPP